MPYPFRYPTPSERRARVKRHRDIALGCLSAALILIVIEASTIGCWRWFVGLGAGMMFGVGVGIRFAHGSED